MVARRHVRRVTGAPYQRGEHLVGLNETQDAVARHDEGVAAMWAVPGSGKTKTVTSRICELVRKRNDPRKILAVTFTRAAADEMNKRIGEYGVKVAKRAGGRGSRVGTYHSLCLEILRDGSPWADHDVDAADKMRLALKQIVGWRGMKWDGVDITKVLAFIGGCKNDLVLPEDSAKWNGLDWNSYDARYPEAYFKYEDERESRGLITFDDMLCLSVRFLQGDVDALGRWQGRYEHVIVDEYQDTNLAQYELVRMLAAKSRSFLVVGDDDQCQPPDTEVMTKEGSVNLGDISVGDEVAVFQRHSGKIVGHRKVSKKAVRKFTGMLREIQVGGTVTRATPDHRFFTRWAENKMGWWAVYLMRKGWKWRVGVCQVFNVEGAFHLGQRARIEGADGVWILTAFRDKTKAHTYEQIVSLRFRLPMCCFVRQKTFVVDPNAIFSTLGRKRLRKRALSCLKHFGRLEDFPLWPAEHSTPGARYGRFGRVMKLRACNLFPGLCRLYVGGSTGGDGGWEEVESVDPISYSGPVVSIEVAEHHSYVADGIASCNCIYQWRGSRQELSTGFAEAFGATEYRAELNYRTRPEVIERANAVVKFNDPHRVSKASVAVREAGGSARALRVADLDAEAETVVEEIRQAVVDGAAWKDHVVLYRTNAQSRAFEEVMLREQVPHVVEGGMDFYSRKEVADLLAYLRLAVDQADDESFKRAVNRPFRFVGKATIDKLERRARRQGISMLEMLETDYTATTWLQERQVVRMWEFVSAVRNVRGEMSSGDGAAQDLDNPAILTRLLSETGYEEWLRGDEGSDTAENSRLSNIRELVRTSGRFKNVTEFLEHVDEVAAMRKKKRRKQNAVRLMTVHRSKGREWPTVFVAGAAEDILPHARGEEREERRLFYVAVTRARDNVLVTCPTEALVGGKPTKLEPSRFVAEAGFVLEGAPVAE